MKMLNQNLAMNKQNNLLIVQEDKNNNFDNNVTH